MFFRGSSRPSRGSGWMRAVVCLVTAAHVTACSGTSTSLLLPAPDTPRSASSAGLGLAWPLDRALHDGVYVMNYVDYGTGDGPRDFACGTRTFDGHTGVDLSLTDFTAMDRGRAVYAALSGTVLVAVDHEFDRNMETPYVGTINNVNMVQIRHDDGTSAWYAHLRANSVAVAPGERVEEGTFLGMVGSSGWSPVPHLHFELWQGVAFGSPIVDPFGAPCSSPTVHWSDPTAYSGNDAVNIYDADITLDLGLEGSFGNIVGIRPLKERLDRPSEVGVLEPRLGIWVFHQSPQGGAMRIRVLRPNGAVFTDQMRAVAGGRPFAWDVLAVPFAATGVEVGVWTLQVGAGTRTIERVFRVGASTTQPPRFYPVRGKSIRLGSGTSRDELLLRGGTSGLVFKLVDAPSGVRLDGSAVVFETVALPHRNARFTVTAVDTAGREDTMYYHLVDRTRPASPLRW